jgi:hypothetical protein
VAAVPAAISGTDRRTAVIPLAGGVRVFSWPSTSLLRLGTWTFLFSDTLIRLFPERRGDTFLALALLLTGGWRWGEGEEGLA